MNVFRPRVSKMLKLIVITVITIIVIIPVGCQRLDYVIKRNLRNISIKQGVAGTLTEINGDENTLGSVIREKPTIRNIKIYEYTTIDQTDRYYNSDYYNSVSTQLITTITSNKNGFFEKELPIGKYSLFIEENGKLYSNGGINSVTIEENKVCTLQLSVDYVVY